MKELLQFQVAQQRYAVRAALVKEVLPRAALTPLADAPATVVGILRLRGELVLVVDLRRRLGLAPLTPRLSQCVVVALIGGVAVGILVDAVDGLVAADSLHAATGSVRAGRIVERIFETGHGVLTLLDVESIVGIDVRAVIATMTDRQDAPEGGGTPVRAAEGAA